MFVGLFYNYTVDHKPNKSFKFKLFIVLKLHISVTFKSRQNYSSLILIFSSYNPYNFETKSQF